MKNIIDLEYGAFARRETVCGDAGMGDVTEYQKAYYRKIYPDERVLSGGMLSWIVMGVGFILVLGYWKPGPAFLFAVGFFVIYTFTRLSLSKVPFFVVSKLMRGREEPATGSWRLPPDGHMIHVFVHDVGFALIFLLFWSLRGDLLFLGTATAGIMKAMFSAVDWFGRSGRDSADVVNE